MSKWKEIRNNFYNEIEECITIDAWKTCSDDEEGKVVAKVYKDEKKGVVYLDKNAENDEKVQIAIKEAIEALKNKS